MFRTLSRILRNNHIIRILAICQVIIIASSCLIFASTQDINGMTQTVYNFTLWSDYTTNVQAYYGSQTASFSDTTLTTIARWLQQIKYYYADQSHTLYMYVPSTNTIQSVTGRHLPEIISYLNYNAAQDAKINYESELLLSRIVTQMGGTNGSYVQDIALDIDAYLPSLMELSKLNSIDWVNTNIKSIRSMGTSISSQNINPADNTALGPGTYYARLSEFTYSYIQSGRPSSVWRFDLPFRASALNRVNDLLTNIELVQSDGTPLNARVFYTWEYSGNFYTPRVYVYDFRMPHSYPDSLYFKITFANNFFYRNDSLYAYYLPDDTLDSYLVSYFGLLEEIKNKDFTADISGDVTIDTSDIIDAINNLSLQDNNVKLNLNINNNTGSDGTNIINRLQNFFNTGTSISDFFDNVDDAESGWFTQTNSDLINTLSGGYVNLYE